MRLGNLNKPSWIVLPAVSMTMAYGGVIACWFVYIACTLSYAPIFHEGPYRLIDTSVYWTFSAANVALAIWLLLSLAPVRRAAASLRRGQFAGIGISLVFLGALQFGAQALHHDLNPHDRTDPETIAAFITDQSAADQALISCVREALQSTHPGLREALWNDALVYQHEGQFSHQFKILESEAQLEIYGLSSPPSPADAGPWSFGTPLDSRSASLEIPLPLEAGDLSRLAVVVRGLPHGASARAANPR